MPLGNDQLALGQRHHAYVHVELRIWTLSDCTDASVAARNRSLVHRRLRRSAPPAKLLIGISRRRKEQVHENVYWFPHKNAGRLSGFSLESGLCASFASQLYSSSPPLSRQTSALCFDHNAMSGWSNAWVGRSIASGSLLRVD